MNLKVKINHFQIIVPNQICKSLRGLEFSTFAFEMTIEELNLLSESTPLVIDFWATWCEPCTWLDPILNELALDNARKWQLLKIDIDLNSEIALHHTIRSVPTTLVFYKGKELGRYSGMMWKKQFGEWIDAQLAAGSL